MLQNKWTIIQNGGISASGLGAFLCSSSPQVDASRRMSLMLGLGLGGTPTDGALEPRLDPWCS
jgi:hypothetical protein